MDPARDMSPEDREAYSQHRLETRRVEQKVLDAIAEAVKGSVWEVDRAVLTEVIVAMNWVDDDGDHFMVWLNTGSWTQAEGMARRILRDVKSRELMVRESPD